MTGKKKAEPKPKEQVSPADHPPVEEPARPMAAPEPALEDRVAALEKAMIKVDEFCTKHNRYHFGGTTG